MERVQTLVDKLQQQLQKHAPAYDLLVTADMLRGELNLLLKNAGQPELCSPVFFHPPILPATQKSLPGTTVHQTPELNSFETASGIPPLQAEPISSPLEEAEPEADQEGKIIQVLQVDEAEIEAELEEIKRNAATIQHFSGKGKPQLLFDLGEDEIPTLAQQPRADEAPKEINETIHPELPSLNDILKAPATELSEKLHQETPVRDLKKAIGINERYQYIHELFRGDEVMYERSIKTINSFSIWPEAEYWIRRELKTKLGWNDQDPAVKQFDHLIKRRFS